MRTVRFARAPLLLFVSVFVLSCGGRRENSMSFENVTVVDSFPEVVDLNPASSEDVGIDVPGIWDVISRDSVLIVVSTREAPVVSLFEYESLKPRGDFLHHGNGPKELLPYYMPSRYRTRFYMRADSLYAEIANGNKNTLRWNVTASYADGEERIDELPPFSSAKSLFRWQLNDSTVLCRSLEDSNTRLVRELYVSGEEKTPTFLEELNAAKISTPNDGYLINLLSTFVAYSPDKDIVAESALTLNVINLYSLHSDFHKSLTLGKKPMDISRAEKITKRQSRIPRSIWYSASYDDFFAILYGREEAGREIMLFAWDGTPLRKYVMHERVTAFDFNGSTLLTLDSETETIRRYRIR